MGIFINPPKNMPVPVINDWEVVSPNLFRAVSMASAKKRGKKMINVINKNSGRHPLGMILELKKFMNVYILV